MQRRGTDQLLVYSGVSDGDPDCRETSFIKAVTAQGGFEAITVNPGELARYEQELLMTGGSLEELFDASMTIVMLLYLMARDRGQRVMLDGVEGDMVHSLSASYPASLFRSGLYFTAVSESANSWRHAFGRQHSLRNVFNWTLRGAFIPDWLRRWRRQLLQGGELKGTLINREFAREVDIESRLARFATHSARGFDLSLREKHVKTVMHPFLTTALERYDRVAAICSVEPRHPLLDKRLVELSVSLPWDQKVRRGWSKFTIRRAGQSFLPEEVMWRRGWDDIGWKFTSALIQNRSAWMADEVGQRQSLLARYIDPKMLKAILNDSHVVAPSEHEESIWRIFHLANWLQRNARNGIG